MPRAARAGERGAPTVRVASVETVVRVETFAVPTVADVADRLFFSAIKRVVLYRAALFLIPKSADEDDRLVLECPVLHCVMWDVDADCSCLYNWITGFCGSGWCCGAVCGCVDLLDFCVARGARGGIVRVAGDGRA